MPRSSTASPWRSPPSRAIDAILSTNRQHWSRSMNNSQQFPPTTHFFLLVPALLSSQHSALPANCTFASPRPHAKLRQRSREHRTKCRRTVQPSTSCFFLLFLPSLSFLCPPTKLLRAKQRSRFFAFPVRKRHSLHCAKAFPQIRKEEFK